MTSTDTPTNHHLAGFDRPGQLDTLSPEDRRLLIEDEPVNIGDYYPWRAKQPSAFVIGLNARPLAVLAEEAAKGRRVYELMSIRRPGDTLSYEWLRPVAIGPDVVDRVRSYFSDSAESLLETGLPLVDFDRCFNWQGDDTAPCEAEWLNHRKSAFWNERAVRLLSVVQRLQAWLRQSGDFLVQHELKQIDRVRHHRDFAVEICRCPTLDRILDASGEVPKRVREAILGLIGRDEVRSVSCPFSDYALWRTLVTEQVRRSERQGLPPQAAFYLSGPDSGLPHVPFEDWGGDIHIPYEGACGGDLFITPPWHRFADAPWPGSRLEQAVGKRCNHVLVPGDHGELAGATREVVDDWVLYTSTEPHEDCSPYADNRRTLARLDDGE